MAELDVAEPVEGARSLRVFISYAHDDHAHVQAVRSLWIFLRAHGVDAVLDLPAAEEPQDWSHWTADEIRSANFILIVGSPEYRRRAEGRSAPNVGRGVQWEAGLIRNLLYEDQRANRKRVLGVLLPDRSIEDLPDWLAPLTSTHYVVSECSVEGAERLYRLLTGQPAELIPALGEVVRLAPLDNTYVRLPPVPASRRGPYPAYHIPTDSDERTHLVSERPQSWQWLLFLGVLAERRRDLEPKWARHVARESWHPTRSERSPGGKVLYHRFLDEQMWLLKLAVGLNPTIKNDVPAAIEGDNPEAVEDVALRLMSAYEDMLDWASRVRTMPVPLGLEAPRSLLGDYATAFLEGIHCWIDELSEEVSNLPERSESFTVVLVLNPDDGVSERLDAARELMLRA